MLSMLSALLKAWLWVSSSDTHWLLAEVAVKGALRLSQLCTANRNHQKTTGVSN